MAALTDRWANIVIIGAAPSECRSSFAALAGERNMLVKKSQYTHGSTWHVAGLAGWLPSKHNIARLMQNMVLVLDRLDER